MSIGLCLSGGGFRATLFHLGSLIRLNELGVLPQIKTISSVSGGSVINGILAKNWDRLILSNGQFANFDELIVEPTQRACGEDLRTNLLARWLNPLNLTEKWKLLSKDYSLTNLLVNYYGENLGFDIEISNLPSTPQFIFCATNLESGANWEYQSGSTGKMGDFIVGFRKCDATLANAVAASSAFTPLFPPLIIQSEPNSFQGGAATDLTFEKNRMALTDGGIYDNLGIEPIWNLQNPKHDFVLVSDAGRPTHYEDEPSQNMVGRLQRSFNIALGQIGAVRKRWLIREYIQGNVKGSYWGLNSNHQSYSLPNSQGHGSDAIKKLNRVRTDLDSFSDAEQSCLINHGYSITDTAIQKWSSNLIVNPATFDWPFPDFATDTKVMEALANSEKRGLGHDILNWAMEKIGV